MELDFTLNTGQRIAIKINYDNLSKRYEWEFTEFAEGAKESGYIANHHRVTEPLACLDVIRELKALIDNIPAPTDDSKSEG